MVSNNAALVASDRNDGLAFGVAICEALGLAPATVNELWLHIQPGGICTARVSRKLRPNADEHRTLRGVMEQFDLHPVYKALPVAQGG